jgi:hypothetical protein
MSGWQTSTSEMQRLFPGANPKALTRKSHQSPVDGSVCDVRAIHGLRLSSRSEPSMPPSLFGAQEITTEGIDLHHGLSCQIWKANPLLGGPLYLRGVIRPPLNLRVGFHKMPLWSPPIRVLIMPTG